MLLATLLKTAPSLGTNQGLGRALTLGLMRDVHLVRVNCLVKMLTAILPNAEPIDLLCRLFSKGLQLPAVGATAIQLYRLGPIRRLPGRELAAQQEEFSCTLPLYAIWGDEAAIGSKGSAMFEGASSCPAIRSCELRREPVGGPEMLKRGEIS